MKKKGFTLIELLVVISIIALLMAILMPALNRVRQMAYRMVCGTNLSGIGRSAMIYSNDNEEEYPRAGGRRSYWDTEGKIDDWTAPSQDDAFGFAPAGATITASFYLLIINADVTPKQFVCKGDGAKIFRLSDASGLPDEADDITDVWDFGDNTRGTLWPGEYCSYSYHLPYDASNEAYGRPVTTASNPACPLCADRNPYLDRHTSDYLDGELGAKTDEEAPTWVVGDAGEAGHYFDPDRTGNAASHQREGQNVLFNDAHVTFERYPNIGINNDNIWKRWPTGDIDLDEDEQQVGVPGESGSQPPKSIGSTSAADLPQAEEDAYLVNEYNGDPTDLPVY